MKTVQNSEVFRSKKQSVVTEMIKENEEKSKNKGKPTSSAPTQREPLQRPSLQVKLQNPCHAGCSHDTRIPRLWFVVKTESLLLFRRLKQHEWIKSLETL